MSNTTKRWLAAVGLILLGMLAVMTVRFFTYKSQAVHYHANFALYVNDQRDLFKSPLFYEEVSICSTNNKSDPKSRVHMHDENPGLVHVHDNAVTWGQFFANLGYTLGNSVLTTNTGTFVDGQGGNLTFTLNGQQAIDIANRVIGDRDRLLVNFGNDNQTTLVQHYNAVPTDAAKADMTTDPASCSGSGSSHLSFGQRLEKAVLIWQN